MIVIVIDVVVYVPKGKGFSYEKQYSKRYFNHFSDNDQGIIKFNLELAIITQ